MFEISNWKVEKTPNNWIDVFAIAYNGKRICNSDIACLLKIKYRTLYNVLYKFNASFISTEVSYFIEKEDIERVIVALTLMVK